jgi:hypothetical protein
VLRGLWDRLSFGIVPKGANVDMSLDRWLLLAARLEPALLNTSERDEVRVTFVLRWSYLLIL